jgi:hypothetical protein
MPCLISWNLNSKYSIILYKWLSMHLQSIRTLSKKGGRRKEQLENIEIQLSKLSELKNN